LNYRSDIDGLRTIAVFTVILNHAGFTFFSGGFIGVDVFFVISGFLITSIIYPKITENTFNIGWFLSRRIKRLMPVLFFIVLVTIVVFSLVMLPQDLMVFYRSVIWVLLYAGNFFMWIHHGGYFDGNSQEAPLLHTWSLAVEEQYYFVWPLMLIVSIKFFGAKITAWLSLVLFIALTIFSQWGTEVTVGAAYYLLPTRFFELLLGSCLAIFWARLPSVSQKGHDVLSIIGLALIIGSALLLTEHSDFPGYNALYPTLGTALLIYSQRGFINKILATKPMVFTGNISYSLYLWHWPIFALLRYMSIELTLAVQLMSIALTYALSIFSYQYIEQPFRKSRINNFMPIAVKFYAIPTVIFASVAALGVYYQGYPSRFEQQIVTMEQAINTHSSDSRKACHSAFRDNQRLPSDECIIGNKNELNGGKGVFIFGDSHANHLVPFISELIKDSKSWGQDYTLDRCIPIVGLNWGGNIYKAEHCKKRNAKAMQYVQEQGFKYVVMAASWPGIETQRMFNDVNRLESGVDKTKLFTEQLQHTVELIIAAGAIPVLIEDTPTLAGKSPKCPIKKIIFDDSLDCSISLTDNPFISTAFSQIQKRFSQVLIIKPSELYCINNECSMMLKNTPLYRDDDHLNERGAEILAVKYLEQYANFID